MMGPSLFSSSSAQLGRMEVVAGRGGKPISPARLFGVLVSIFLYPFLKEVGLEPKTRSHLQNEGVRCYDLGAADKQN